MAPPRTVVTTSSCSLPLIYQPWKDERLAEWPSWLTYSGRFTHISGQPSAAGRAQGSESSPVKDQRSTAVAGISTILLTNCYKILRIVYRVKLQHGKYVDPHCVFLEENISQGNVAAVCMFGRLNRRTNRWTNGRTTRENNAVAGQSVLAKAQQQHLSSSAAGLRREAR